MHVIEQFNGGVYEIIIVFVEKIMDQHYSDVLNDFKFLILYIHKILAKWEWNY